MSYCPRCHSSYSGEVCPCSDDRAFMDYDPHADARRCPNCGGIRSSAGAMCGCGYHPDPIGIREARKKLTSRLSSMVEPKTITRGADAQSWLEEHRSAPAIQCAACGAQATADEARERAWGVIPPVPGVDGLTRDYFSPQCGQRLYGALKAGHDAYHGRRLGRHFG